MSEKTVKSKLGLWIFSSLFIINFIGIIALFFLLKLDDKIDAIAKVVSAVWAFLSALLLTLGWKKEEGKLSLQDVLLLRPLKILNIFIFIGLLSGLFLKFGKTIPVKIHFRDDYGEVAVDSISVDNHPESLKNLRLTHGQYQIQLNKTDYYQLNDSLYIPLLRVKSIHKNYRLRLKKGIIQFKINTSNAKIKLFPESSNKTKVDTQVIQIMGQEFTTDSLPIGKYEFLVQHEWFIPEHRNYIVETNRRGIESVILEPKRTGVNVTIDKQGLKFKDGKLQNNISVFLNHSYQPEYSGNKLNFFIAINNLNGYLLEIKDIDNQLYYSGNFALNSPGQKNLQCVLTYQAISWVEIEASGLKGEKVNIDDEFRGFLDATEGTITLPLFDGYRKISIGKWERTIKFPILDNYLFIP